MKMRTRSIVGVGLAAIGVLAWTQSPLTAEEMGLDIWNVSDLETQIARGERRNSELDRADQLIQERIRFRQRILANLYEEKITLEEAGRGFLTLNLTEPTAIGYLRTTSPKGTDLDLSVRQVVMQMRCFPAAGSAERHDMLKCELAVARPHMAW